MGLRQGIWAAPSDFLRARQPDEPVLFYAPGVLQDTARRFLGGFGGLVSYAVKANPDPLVLGNFAAAGIRAFDVASPREMDMARAALPDADLHYNNPIRSGAEIEAAVRMGVLSYSVDSRSELAKLVAGVPQGAEISVRFKLPVKGGVYDFGAKFGAEEDEAMVLLQEIAAGGFRPAMTFHPGTQCTDPAAWAHYIAAAARIAGAVGIRLDRLNVGGGFPARRDLGDVPGLEAIFDRIADAARAAFGADTPKLVCEPGRALVAEGASLAARVKAIRDGQHVFLNDGIYGGLAEMPLMGVPDRISVLSPQGQPRSGPPVARTIFGPTCDSIDKLPGEPPLPADIQEGDYVLLHGFGAYTAATASRFNGYGALQRVTVMDLHG